MGNTCVIDKDVDRTKAFLDYIDHSGRVPRVCSISLRQNATAAAAHHLRGLTLAMAIIDGNICPRRRQRKRYGAPDASAAACASAIFLANILALIAIFSLVYWLTTPALIASRKNKVTS